MFGSAMDGTCLALLVRMAIPICIQAERECPRTGRGRKPEIPDWVIAVLIMIVVVKKKKTKSAQYRYLLKHRRELMKCLDTDRFPSRSTYFDRYRRAHELFAAAIRIQGVLAISAGLADPDSVAVDKSIIPTRGPRWNRRQVARGRIPLGADLEATWTYSKYHGWILGYSYEVVVTTGKNGVIWPILASSDPACWQAARTFPAKIRQLPAGVRYVLADSGFDSNHHGEAIEWDPHGRHTGRRFLCPQIYRRGENRRPQSPPRESGSRAIHRQRREQRRRFFKTPRGQRLYRRRSQTVEPFNDWVKSRFELHNRVWHRGLNNNRTQLLAAIFCYQLLLRYNHSKKRYNGQIQWILDAL